MSEVTTIGLDIAKNVFHAHGADADGAPLFSRKINRTKLLDFFAREPRCLVASEACGGANHWARELTLLGHEVKLIPSGGKQKLGSITKMGERTLRRLLIIGCSAVVLQASKRGAPAGSWLEQMMARSRVCWSPSHWPTRRRASSGPCS